LKIGNGFLASGDFGLNFFQRRSVAANKWHGFPPQIIIWGTPTFGQTIPKKLREYLIGKINLDLSYGRPAMVCGENPQQGTSPGMEKFPPKHRPAVFYRAELA
jgi:hypothetical protein